MSIKTSAIARMLTYVYNGPGIDHDIIIPTRNLDINRLETWSKYQRAIVTGSIIRPFEMKCRFSDYASMSVVS